MTTRVAVKAGSGVRAAEDGVVLFRHADGEDPPAFAEVAKVLGPAFRQALKGCGFEGKPAHVALVHTMGRLPARVVVVAGLGPRESMTSERVRQAAARAAQRARDAGCERLAFDMNLKGLDPGEIARACAEGALLGLYRFTGYKTDRGDDRRQVRHLTLLATDGALASAKAGARRGEIIADGVNQARELGNLPSNAVTPTHIAERARALARAHGFTCEVIDRKGMERLKMGALLGVARGSLEPPKLIILRYDGARPPRGRAARSRPSARSEERRVGKECRL